MDEGRIRYIWAALRIALGWLFLWAFVDKLLGLGFATPAEGAWLRGGSPTAGFLTHATAGPLAGLYQAMAGNPLIDFLFMGGLLCLGVALLLGIGVQIAGYAGTLFVLLLWSAHLPPANNPLLDEHLIYAIILIGLAWAKAGQWVGLGRWWSRLVGENLRWLE